MDPARAPLIRQLIEADRYGRLRIFSPQTAGGAGIIVHSKVGIFDDLLAWVGSANLNNRSEGFDTECELAVRAHDPAARVTLAHLRDRLIGHYLGITAEAFARTRAAAGGVIPALDLLNTEERLVRLSDRDATWWGRFVASRTLGDPTDVAESWRLRKISSRRRA
jgi:phosphatidylserine/phosphatidylglycerophosphate/cardiolipin synthase-like enzyme